MDRRRVPSSYLVVLAAAVLGLLVMPVAFAGVGDAGAAKSANVTKQLKKLKRRVAALEAKPDQVGQVPASLPPSGAAGGDLTGTYPNPEIAAGAVDTAALAGLGVTNAKLGPDAVTGDKVLDGSLGLSDLARSVQTVSWDPPPLTAGDCAANQSLTVPGKDASDRALVLPGTFAAGWNVNLILGGYSSTGGAGNSVGVQVCDIGGSLDPLALPFVVLLFD